MVRMILGRWSQVLRGDLGFNGKPKKKKELDLELETILMNVGWRDIGAENFNSKVRAEHTHTHTQTSTLAIRKLSQSAQITASP